MHIPRFKKTPLSIAIGGVLTIWTIPNAFAQTSSEQNTTVVREIEEVTVTAERRESSLQSTAVAVSAVSQDTLTKNDILNVSDLSAFAPSLMVSGQEEQSDIKIYIRGVGTNNPTEAGDQGVGVYVDGVFAARAQGALALMYDLESVQVLRGPQGTLFGRNNTGGALLLETKKPGSEFEGDFQITYGSYNRRQASGGVTLPVTDNLSFRVAGYVDKDDGWVDTLSTDPRGSQHGYSGGNIPRTTQTDLKLNNTDVHSVRVTGIWDISDSIVWNLSFETFTDKGNGGIILNPVEVEKGNFEAFIDSPVSKNLTSDVLRSSLSADLFDSVNVEYIFGISDLHRDQVVDQDGGITSRFQEARTEYQDSEAQSHEIKFQNTHGERLDWTVGFYYFEEETAIRFDFDGYGAWLNGGATFIQPARGTESEAAYGQLTYHVTDSFSLTGGIRYTDDLKYDRGGRNFNDCGDEYIDPNLGGSNLSTYEDFLNNRTGGEGADGLDDRTGRERVRGQCAATTRNDIENENSQTTYLARASYEWDDSLLYGSVSTGYRAGVVQDGGEATEPENITSYEVGYKFNYGPVRFNTAVFHMEYEDLIRSGFDEEENRILTSNVAGAEISGLEWELKWLVGSAGVFDFSGSYLDAVYTDYHVDNPGTGTNNTDIVIIDGAEFYDLAGNSLPQSPEYSFSASFLWDFDIGEQSQLTPRINLRYVDDVYFRDQNENRAPVNNIINDQQQEGFYWGNPAGQDAYAKVNLGLTYATGDWVVDLFVNNATDEMTRSSAAIDNGTAKGYPGRYDSPRTWGIRVNTSF